MRREALRLLEGMPRLPAKPRLPTGPGCPAAPQRGCDPSGSPVLPPGPGADARAAEGSRQEKGTFPRPAGPSSPHRADRDAGAWYAGHGDRGSSPLSLSSALGPVRRRESQGGTWAEQECPAQGGVQRGD